MHSQKVYPTALQENALQRNHEYLPRVAFWLVPQRQERVKLQSLIVGLAQQFSAPVFVPHVTVYSCCRTPQQRELTVMAGLINSCRPVTMRPIGLAGKDRLTQTLFVKLDKNAAMIELYQSLHAGVSQPSSYDLEPHLSLLYQYLPTAVRESLVRESLVSLREIRFDELWAVAIPKQLKSLDAFDGWQPLLICRLASSPIADTINQTGH